MLPQIITSTNLYTNSLGREYGADLEKTASNKFTASFVSFRERAATLANEIHCVLPDLTVHDITHLDALWEIADLICGNDYKITPSEAFVLGGAILLHDIGMALAASEGGLENIKAGKNWKDLVVSEYEKIFHRKPTNKEIDAPPHEIEINVLGYILRATHAKSAESLGRQKLTGNASKEGIYLIEDLDIRNYYGRIIGQIAHSHWWPISKLEKEFSRTMGPAPWCPRGWEVDPLKIAAILRSADIAHLDGRRAPKFLRVLRAPKSYSDKHWCFQERLSKPRLVSDSLEYSAGDAFTASDAEAWWLAFDSLSATDQELRSVDAMLSDKKLPRFTARRVSGVESPERLMSYIPTDGWVPIDAKILVSDLPKVVESLGGNALYGNKPSAALRELLQNSTDAIRARRVLDSRSENWGQIRVTIKEQDNAHWLEVDDCGIGMSLEVLTKCLLDFGKSYWKSDLMRAECPGLQSGDFNATGRFGIGFFSVFMLGDSLTVRSRRFENARDETWVLEFNQGVKNRPIVRKANPSEMLNDGGTCIRVRLNKAPTETGGLLRSTRLTPQTLDGLLKRIAPATDVSIWSNHNAKLTEAVSANYWILSKPEEFVRLIGVEFHGNAEIKPQVENIIYKDWANRLSSIKDEKGNTCGRAALTYTVYELGSYSNYGCVTVGGFLATQINGIGGILIGDATTASRDSAYPKVTYKQMLSWLKEQIALTKKYVKNPNHQAAIADTVRSLGGDTDSLPIVKINGKWANAKELTEKLKKTNKVNLLYDYEISSYEDIPTFKYSSECVICVSAGSHMTIFNRDDSDWPSYPSKWNSPERSYHEREIAGLFIECLCKAWGKTPNDWLLSLRESGPAKCIYINGKLISLDCRIFLKPKKTNNKTKKPLKKLSRK